MTNLRRFNTKDMRLLFPDSWLVDDDGSEVSISRSEDGGAITVSIYRHSDPRHQVNASEQCGRFIVSRGQDPKIVHGTQSEATAEFEDEDGSRWIIRTLVRKNRFALATYNAPKNDPEEEREARDILRSIEIDV